MTSAALAQLHVFRVSNGNGNACAFVFPDKSLGIVDWGTGDANRIDALLNRVQPSRVRFVLATHSHGDHTLGLLGVLKACLQRGLVVDNFFYPAIGRLKLTPSDYLWHAVIFAKNNGIPIHPISLRDFDPRWPERPFAIAQNPEWDVSVLAPPSGSNNRHQITSHLSGINPGNPTNIVLLFRYRRDDKAAGRVLLPDDATPAVLRFAADHVNRHPEFHIDNDVTVVPHHGSKDNWPAWLTAHVKGIAVISAGTNRPKHPSLHVLRLLGTHCRNGKQPSSLFCTSYAQQCRDAFAHQATDPALVTPGPCFGDVEIEVSPNDSHVIAHDPDGPARRAYDYCT